MHNRRVKYVGGRLWQRWRATHASELLPGVRAEIERECERLSLVPAQMRAIEAQQRQAVAGGREPQIARLTQLGAIGIAGAWALVKELFGWRSFRNRREVAGCLGLTIATRTATSALLADRPGRRRPARASLRGACVGGWWVAIGSSFHVSYKMAKSAQLKDCECAARWPTKRLTAGSAADGKRNASVRAVLRVEEQDDERLVPAVVQEHAQVVRARPAASRARLGA